MKQLVTISHNITIYEKGHKNIEGFDVELEGEGAEVSVSVGATSVSIGETTYLSGFYIMVLGAICMTATGIYGIRCDRNR